MDKPTAGATSYHQGYDIGAHLREQFIVETADGVVTSTGYSSVLGNYVILSHGGGLFTIYEHCSAVLVSQGQSVSRGSTIAKVGSTSVSTGPHLHFGVQLNGKYVDPGNYLKG
ncbi:MAG: M23 family metallopeptidase [Eubacterium ramulus]